MEQSLKPLVLFEKYWSISPFVVHLHTVTRTLVAVVSQEELVELNFHKPVLRCLAEKGKSILRLGEEAFSAQ